MESYATPGIGELIRDTFYGIFNVSIEHHSGQDVDGVVRLATSEDCEFWLERVSRNFEGNGYQSEREDSWLNKEIDNYARNFVDVDIADLVRKMGVETQIPCVLETDQSASPLIQGMCLYKPFPKQLKMRRR